MRKIKNLVFDLGGVLVEISLQGSVEAFKAIGFKDVEQYLNAYTQKGFIGDVEAGNISDEEFRQQVSRHVGREVSWEDCQRGWLGFMTEVKQANLDQLLKFKTMGYKIALLSNTNPFIARWFHSNEFDGRGHSLDDFIPREHQYLSFEQRSMKPGSKIFETMLTKERFNPDETMFIDDGTNNIKAAQELGIHAFQPVNGEVWGRSLENLLE